jgi:hypothetical protein
MLNDIFNDLIIVGNWLSFLYCLSKVCWLFKRWSGSLKGLSLYRREWFILFTFNILVECLSNRLHRFFAHARSGCCVCCFIILWNGFLIVWIKLLVSPYLESNRLRSHLAKVSLSPQFFKFSHEHVKVLLEGLSIDRSLYSRESISEVYSDIQRIHVWVGTVTNIV